MSRSLEFGVLFTSHPNSEEEPYPHQSMHARVTDEILTAEALGYDQAWLAEHHFSTEYGIMPDVWVYAAYIAALTKRIRLAMGVVTLPLTHPVRVAENAAFVDILSNGRVMLGLGSGYRAYEFEGFGLNFEARRDAQEEALPLLMDLLLKKRAAHKGRHYSVQVDGKYEMLPHALQKPHPPVLLAGGTDRSIAVAGRMGLGLMLSTLTPFAELKRQAGVYRDALEGTPTTLRGNPGRGQVDIARWVYVAETDAQAKAESEAGLVRHLKHFFGASTSGYLGQASQGTDSIAAKLDYDTLTRSTILHGSPKTVIARIEELQAATGLTSLMLHYPPWYGKERAKASLALFASEVMPRFKTPAE